MENKKQVGTSSSSSLDHLFGPKDSTSSSSYSSSGIFGSMFSTPSTGRDPGFHGYQVGNIGRHGNPDNISKGENSGISGKEKSSVVYQNETVEPCYFSSSIHYGGRENYSSRTMNSSESRHMCKKDGGNDDDANGDNSNCASRGNWWQGSLYY